MSKPYVESKYKELCVLMRQLKAIQSLDHQQCWAIFGLGKCEMKEKIYKQIADTAGRI